MSNGNSNEKKPKTPTSPPGSFMSDLRKGIGSLFGRAKREKEAQGISADKKSGNPLHYQTHVNDDRKNRQGAGNKRSPAHHGKS